MHYKRFVHTSRTALLLLMASLVSCLYPAIPERRDAGANETSVSETGANAEFIADENTFTNWRRWQTIGAPLSGPGAMPTIINAAHEAMDNTITRQVYANAIAVTAGTGTRPPGSIFLKEMRRADGNPVMILAMVKRGGSFNASHRGWEWFELNAAGSILRRSSALPEMCNECHTQATNDYVFSLR